MRTTLIGLLLSLSSVFLLPRNAVASPELARSSVKITEKQELLFSADVGTLLQGELLNNEIGVFNQALAKRLSEQKAQLQGWQQQAQVAFKTIRALGIQPEHGEFATGGAGAGISDSSDSSFAQLSSLPTMLIGGAIHFVRKRAKEEALRFILGKLDSELCSKKGGQDLLPSFCTLLSQVDESRWIAPLSLLLPALREDLEKLPRSIFSNLSDKDSPRLHCALGTGVSLYEELNRVPSTNTISTLLLTTLSNPNCMPFFYGPDLDKNWTSHANTISTLRVTLGALLEFSDKGEADNAAELQQLAQAKLLALLPSGDGHDEAIVSLSDELSGESEMLSTLLAPSSRISAAKFAAAWLQLKGIQEQVEVFLLKERKELEAQLKTLHHAFRATFQARLHSLSSVLFVLRTRLDSLASSRRSKEAPNIEAEFRLVFDESISLLKSFVEAKHVHARKAERLLHNASILLRSMEALRQKRFAPGISLLLSTGLFKDNSSMHVLLPFLELLAGLADAKTSEDVSELIENAALPTGSWREKRRQFTIGVSAQFGVAGGIERSASDNSPHLGAYIPVGVDVSWPIGENWAGGILMQIVDLGTVTSTRLGQELEVKREPRYELSSIFAPGVQGYLGIGNSPFVVGVGVDIAPTLREASDGATSSALRGRLSLSIDLPVYMF